MTVAQTIIYWIDLLFLCGFYIVLLGVVFAALHDREDNGSDWSLKQPFVSEVSYKLGQVLSLLCGPAQTVLSQWSARVRSENERIPMLAVLQKTCLSHSSFDFLKLLSIKEVLIKLIYQLKALLSYELCVDRCYQPVFFPRHAWFCVCKY